MKTHGLSKHKLYPVWLGMRQRCTDSNHISYQNYGGKGIKVCTEWDSFEQFLSDMGERPDGDISIERINSNADYCAENCRWATRLEQNSNKKNNKQVTFNGVTRTLKEWSRIVGIRYETLIKRYNYNWDAELMLTTKPVIGRNQTGIKL